MALGLTMDGVVDSELLFCTLHSTMHELPVDAFCQLRTSEDAKIDVSMPSASHQPCESSPVPNADLSHRHAWCFTDKTQWDAKITRS
jgi:hypothetical protein